MKNYLLMLNGRRVCRETWMEFYAISRCMYYKILNQVKIGVISIDTTHMNATFYHEAQLQDICHLRTCPVGNLLGSISTSFWTYYTTK